MSSPVGFGNDEYLSYTLALNLNRKDGSLDLAPASPHTSERVLDCAAVQDMARTEEEYHGEGGA